MKRTLCFLFLVGCLLVCFGPERLAFAQVAGAPLPSGPMEMLNREGSTVVSNALRPDVLCVFGANIDFLNKMFQLQMDFEKNESINAKIQLLTEDKFQLQAQLDHLKILKYDLSTELEGSGGIVRDAEKQYKYVQGQL
ncbi:hypothetical protein ACFL38_05055, partial [Candidatus Omnitrophota bacterium]